MEYVGEGRQQESLDAFWESLTAEQLAGVEAVAMDMWEPFVQSTLSHVPGAVGKIVHDPFHLVQYMNEAVNEVRKSEHRRLQAPGRRHPQEHAATLALRDGERARPARPAIR